MSDSVQILQNSDYLNRIHGRGPHGRLHKGHNVTAATSSIPSKYQTIVIENAERRGFNSRTKRFNYDASITDNPGPGNYVSHGTLEKNTHSFSKRGSGGFASKDRRMKRHEVPAGPGAGTYALPSMLQSAKDFNRGGNTGNFHRPIAVKREDRHPFPAPNAYEGVTRTYLGKTNNVAADAAFKSRSKREVINTVESQNKPAPCQYVVNDNLVKSSVKDTASSFKSKSKRQMQPSPAPVPGPGAYKPFEPVEQPQKTVFPRKHYLCISAPAMPLPATPPQPGPGAYEMVDYEGVPKHYMSGSAFVSTTSRWTGGQPKGTVGMPGPAHYRPQELGKQSFIYNSANKWI